MHRVLCLSEEQQQQVAEWALVAYPHEACGTLLGRREGDETRVVEARVARNINTARAHDRFEIDPVDYLAAEQAAAAAGIDLVGIWHTHPDHPACPSTTDRELAWGGWSYLIVSVDAAGVRALRSWRLNGEGRFEEELIRS